MSSKKEKVSMFNKGELILHNLKSIAGAYHIV
jgi:hypothetical protein